MAGEEEVERIIEEKARELMEEVLVDKPGPGSRHGIYRYLVEKGKWLLVRVEGPPLELGEFGDGCYVVYFDNTKCPACRRYDEYWFPFIAEWAPKLQGYHWVIVLCEWFARRCESRAASETFKKYNVKASPTTILAYVEGGRVLHTERYEGYLTREELEKVVPSFRERAEKAKRGEKVEPPLKRETEQVNPLELILKLLKQMQQGGSGGGEES